nr:hypothetical protein [Tanacetum cinerariifolium]
MSTIVFVDPEIFTQADGAQSSRVPVPLLEDPYEAIRQAYLVRTNTESEPFEGEAKAPESPHFVAPPICRVEESEGSSTSGARSTSSDSTAPLLSDHPLTHATRVLVPSLQVAAMSDSRFCKRFKSSYDSLPSLTLPVRKRGRGPTAEDEDPTARDEGLAAGDEALGMGVESRGLDDESRGLDDEGHSIDSDGFGLGEEEEVVPEGQGSGSAPEPERSERVSTLEHEQERTAMTFGALWRPMLALEAWVRRVDTWMTDMSQAGYDDHRLVHDMLLHQTALQTELQEMRDRVTALEQERDRRERWMI